MQKNKQTVVPMSILVEALMACEAIARANPAYPQSRVSLESASGMLPVRRSRLARVGRNLTVGRSLTFWFSSLILVHKGQLHPLARRQSSYSLSSTNMVLTHRTVRRASSLRLLRHPISLSATTLPASRETTRSPKVPHCSRSGETHQAEPSRHKQAPLRVDEPAESGG